MTKWKQLLNGLRNTHDLRLLEHVRGQLDAGGNIAMRAWAVGQKSGVSEEEARILLDKLVALEVLEREKYYQCPCNDECELTAEEAGGEECPHCQQIFKDFSSSGPIPKVRYKSTLPTVEDVCWMVLLHGMNSRGPWQEEFTWLISQHWGYAIPVYVYKYGILRVGVLFRWTQKRLKERVVQQIKVLQQRMASRSYDSRPDVVAHSFGTWLIANALKDNPDLKIRRLVLVAGIVPPDFDWALLFDRGQVEALMCHHSPVDVPVGVTHYVIPNSGPSGRVGFNDRERVIHRLEDGYGHSDYFADEHLEQLINCVWGRFLTLPIERLRSEIENVGKESPDWKRKPWPIRAGRLGL